MARFGSRRAPPETPPAQCGPVFRDNWPAATVAGIALLAVEPGQTTGVMALRQQQGLRNRDMKIRADELDR